MNGVGTFQGSVSTKPLNVRDEQHSSDASNDARQIIEACQAGDEAAFEELYRLYSGQVFSIAIRLTGSQVEAEEVTQEVFVSVYKNIHRFEFQSAFSTWLYRIVVRRAADSFRKAKKHIINRISMDSDDHAPTHTLADSGQSPRDSLLESQKEHTLENAIQKLGTKHRTIVVLRYVQDLSYEEIAQVLECRIGTVKSRLNRAHKLLKQVLEEMNFKA